MLRVGFVLGAAVLLAGCGTVVRGANQNVVFHSMPEGALVTVKRENGENQQQVWSCMTPCKMELSRKRDFTVTYELEGFKPARGRLGSRFGLVKGGASSVPGNVVFGMAGLGVDIVTGAPMQLLPDPMRAQLEPLDTDRYSKIFDMRIEGGGKADVETVERPEFAHTYIYEEGGDHHLRATYEDEASDWREDDDELLLEEALFDDAQARGAAVNNGPATD